MDDEEERVSDDEELVGKRQFINSVRQKALLWNPHHELYGSVTIREKVWKKLADQHGFKDIKEVKEMWKNLRDVYRSTLKRPQYKKDIRPWRYEKQMSFLREIITNSKRKRYIWKSASQVNVEDPVMQEENETDEIEELDPISTENELEYTIKNERSSPENMDHSQIDENEWLRKFFDSMYESTKLLPKKYQLKIKKDVFNIVLNAEEMVLISNQ